MTTVRRRLATLTFTALGALAIVGCKGSGAATGKYIPEGATIVAGFDVAGLQGTGLWKDQFKGLVESKGKEGLDAMAACNLGLDKWKTVTVGATPNAEKGEVAVVLVADGLGKKDNLECAHGKLKESEGGEEPWTAKEDGKVLELAKDGGTAYVIDDNTIVVAGKAWAADVGKLTKGEGKSVFDGSMKDLLGRADTGKHMWFAGALPSEIGDKAKDQLGASVKDVAGHFDLSGGIAMQMSIGVGSKDEAESVKTKVEALYTGFGKEMAKKQGMSDDSLDSVKFGTDGAAFTVSAKVSEDEVKKSMAPLMSML
jgi:hypothetical protein